MMRRSLAIALVCLLAARVIHAAEKAPCVLFDASYGQRLAASTNDVPLWWASSGWKVSRTRPVPRRKGKTVLIRAARNETEAAQLVVRPERVLTGFIATPGALTGPEGAILPADRIDILRVRYVNVERPTDGLGAVAAWPDPLPPFQGPIDLAAGQNQPLWLRVHVPRDARPGRYEGHIRLTANGFNADVPLRVEVHNFNLPDDMTCTATFGFNPSTVWQYQKIADPAQQRAVLDKYWGSFRDHHIDPFGPAPLDPFKVEWVTLTEEEAERFPAEERLARQTYPLTARFDWMAWDAEQERVFDAFGFRSFRLGVPGLGGGTFNGHGKAHLQGFEAATPEYDIAFNSYCGQLEAHLREKGWLEYGYTYWFDEPFPRDYPHVMAGMQRLAKAAPGIRRMLTEQVEPGLEGGPNLWCPLIHYFRPERAEKRRALGEHFWWYVCTVPKNPYCGLFTDHPATDLRVWLWQAWGNGIEGILVWHSNLWTTSTAYPNEPQNPYDDPMSWMSGYGTKSGRKRPWGNGDGRLMYPPEAAATAQQSETILDGPVDSIRWEMLRDGIEDYEYFAILRRLLDEHRSALSATRRRRIEKLLQVPPSVSQDLTHYAFDPAPMEKHRHRLAVAIEKLGGNMDP